MFSLSILEGESAPSCYREPETDRVPLDADLTLKDRLIEAFERRMPLSDNCDDYPDNTWSMLLYDILDCALVCNAQDPVER